MRRFAGFGTFLLIILVIFAAAGVPDTATTTQKSRSSVESSELSIAGIRRFQRPSQGLKPGRGLGRWHNAGPPVGFPSPTAVPAPTTAPAPTTTPPPGAATTTQAPTPTTSPTPAPPTTAPVVTTAPPATTAPATTTTAVTGAPVGAIVVDPSMNVGQVVANSPAGATFYFVAGTYRRATINPKDNQTFIAQAGAVLDGENATKAAFIGPASSVAPSNVTIRGFEVKNYTPTEQAGWNEGAITSKWYEAQGGGTGWVVEGVNVHHNRGAGVMLTNQGVLRNSYVHDNYALGVKLFWAPNGGLIEGNEISNNNFDSAPDFNETGGSKFAWTTGLVVRNNYVHNNSGAGLWTDIDNRETVYAANVVDDNAGPGIEHEISYSVTIQGNTVRRNGHNSQGWLWGGGILIANSSGALIEGNIVSGNQSGIAIIHQNRGSYSAENITVTNNDVSGSGVNGAAQDIGQAGYFAGRVSFDGNRYTNSSWIFGGGTLTWDQWRQAGQDPSGSAG